MSTDIRQWRMPGWRLTSYRYDTAIEYNAGRHALLVSLPDCGKVTVIHNPPFYYLGKHRHPNPEEDA